MANRILSALTETPGDFSPVGWRHSVEIQSSAAGQPGLLITASRQLEDGPEEEITVVVEDGLAFLTPVLKWLLTDQIRMEVIHECVQVNYPGLGPLEAVLEALITVGQKRVG